MANFYLTYTGPEVQDLLDAIPVDASELPYDNTESGLVADDVQGAIDEVVNDIGSLSASDVSALPISGGTLTGKAYAQSNTDYTTSQMRNIVLSTSDPTGGSNGDVWIKYTP